MRIIAEIDYHGPQVFCFDSQKVLVRLGTWFPDLCLDHRDITQVEIEQFTHMLDAHDFEETTRKRVLEQLRGKAARNGPAYNFRIGQDTTEVIDGQVTRYHIFFETSDVMSVWREQQIVGFLQSLGFGTMRCDTQSQHFVVPDPEYPEFWQLPTQSSNHIRLPHGI